jgi:hypothetical protein
MPLEGFPRIENLVLPIGIGLFFGQNRPRIDGNYNCSPSNTANGVFLKLPQCRHPADRQSLSAGWNDSFEDLCALLLWKWGDRIDLPRMLPGYRWLT